MDKYNKVISFLTPQERKRLRDEQFALPSQRKYPIDNAFHTAQSMRAFYNAQESEKPELAYNLIKAAKKFGVNVKSKHILDYASSYGSHVKSEAVSFFMPPNPSQVIIKNNFYPSGLTELDIYTYYMKVKKNLLDWIGGRQVAFFLNIDNQLVVKRKHKGRDIYLTENNYEEIITGRTNSIYVERDTTTNYFVVDVDAAKGIKFSEILKACKLAKDLLTPMDIVKWEWLVTSPHGIHMIGQVKQQYNINQLRSEIENLLKQQTEHLVNIKGRKQGINYDLSPNYQKSLHMARYSLTKEGLICDDYLTSRNAGKRI